jgi:hypothetical protein
MSPDWIAVAIFCMLRENEREGNEGKKEEYKK